MDAVVVKDIPFQPDTDGLKKKLRVRDRDGWADRFAHLVQEAQAIARPRALYGVAYVDERSESSVVVDGITFNSRVLRVNLEQAHRVFPGHVRDRVARVGCRAGRHLGGLLCPRAGCSSRQAPYDPALYDEKYRVEKVESPPGITQEEAP